MSNVELPGLLTRLRVDTSDLQGAVGRAKGIGGEIAGALGVGLTAGGGIAAALEQNTSKARIQGALGLTPAEAAKAAQVSGEIYAGAWGDSLGTVNEAVRAVATNLNGASSIGQASFKGLTTQAIALADAFGQEVGPLAAAAGQMVKTGLADNAQEAFDVLTVGFQNGADKAGDLLDTFNEYGTQFRKLGLDSTTALGLIQQGLQGGARDADIVADTLKEFAIRSVESLYTLDSAGKKTLTPLGEGFRTLGLDGEAMQAKLAKGGPGAAAALGQVLTALRGVEDPATRSRTAVALFGTQSEDMAAALFALDPATAAGAKGMDQVAGAAQRATDAVGGDANGALVTFQRQVQASLGDVFTSVLPALTATLAALQPYSGELATVALAVSGMWAAWKGYQAAATAASVIGKAYAVMTSAKVRDTAATIANRVASSASSAVDVARTLGMVAATYGRLALAKVRDTAATVANAAAARAAGIGTLAASIGSAAAAYGALSLAKARDTAATVANAVAERAASAAKAAGTAIQWALNIAMTANPLGLILVAIVALVAGLVLLFKNSETARNVMLSVWDAIKVGVGAAVAFVRSIIVTVFGFIAAYIRTVTGIWRAVITTVWSVIVAVVTGAINRVRSVIAGIGAVVGVITGAFSRARAGALSALSSLLSFVAGVPGKVLGFFRGIGGKMLGIGGDIVNGLRQGISDSWGRVTGAIESLIARIPKKIRELLGIASPSKVMRDLAKWIPLGFAAGISSKTSEVTKAASGMVNALRIAVASRVRGASSGLLVRVRKENYALAKLATARAAISKRLADAQKAYADVVKARADYATKVTEAAQGYAAITSAGTGRVTTSGVLNNMTRRLADLRKFAALVTELKTKGLNKTSLDQIIQAGVENGTGIATALASGGVEAIRQTNALQGQIDQAATGLGSTAAGSLYDAGVQAAKGLVAGLQSQDRALAAAMSRLARLMAAQIKKALGIRSPSRLFRGFGVNVGQGMALGVEDSTGGVQEALRSMVGLPAAATSAAQFGGMAASNRTYSPTFVVGGQGLSARELMDESAWRARTAGLGGVVMA